MNLRSASIALFVVVIASLVFLGALAVYFFALSGAEAAQAIVAALTFTYVVATVVLMIFTIRQAALSKEASEASARDALIARLDTRGPRVSMRLDRIGFHCYTDAPASEDATDYSPIVPTGRNDRFLISARMIVQNYGNEPAHMLIGLSTLGNFDTQRNIAIPPRGTHELDWEVGVSASEAASLVEQGGWSPGSWKLAWQVSLENLEGSVRDLLHFQGHYQPFISVPRDDSATGVAWRRNPHFQRWGHYASLTRAYPHLP
jgi:hypothetical protein